MRKLSLNKFRLSSEQQETRHTPEGGDSSSRSQSQSPQESPVHPNESIKKQGQEDDNVPEKEKKAKGELKKPEKLLEKPSKIVTIVQHATPSVTIKSFVQQGETCTDIAGITNKICELKLELNSLKHRAFINSDIFL